MGEEILEQNKENSENSENKRLQIKFDTWERKLLDLSTRNSLLNLRIKGSCIPLFVPECSNIEDLIAQEKSFSIKSRGSDELTEETEETAETPEAIKPVEEPAEALPAEASAPAENEAADDAALEKTPEAALATTSDEAPAEAAEPAPEKKAKKTKAIPAKDYSIADLADIEEFRDIIVKNYDKGVLISSLTDAVLDKNIKTLYRGAKTSMEENGANTLFLACGFLKWYEKNRKDPCFAPILLIPVDLVKKFGIKYTMRRRDEDVQFNVTVSEKLRQDFKIEFDAFSKELPTDESGVNVNEVFKQVKEAVSALKGWEVIESCVLGLFSFSQFVMWNDMHSHRDSISKNKIVKSLINGQLEWPWEDISKPGKISEEKALLPLVADSSQLAAIIQADKKENASFVLHGPPGTGKSQTITSIIANCLAKGKKVLFAAEKKAALDVVYKRLEKIGIAPFCLELHSNKVRKSYVLDQINTAKEVNLKIKGDGDYDKALKDITAKRNELDNYVNELHLKHDCGMTLYELINVYASNQTAVDCGSFDDGFVDEINETRIKEIESSLGELVASSGNLNGKLPFVRSSSYSQDAKSKLPSLVETFIVAYDEFAASVAGFDNLLTANNCRIAGEPGTVGRIAGLNYAGTAVTKLKALNLPKALICCDDTEAAYLSIKDALTVSKDALSKRTFLCNYWNEGFLDLDGAALLSELMAAKAKNALIRSMAENNVYKKVKAYDLKGNRKDTLEQDFKLLLDYKKAIQNAANYISSVRGYLGDYYDPAAILGFDMIQVELLNENAHAAFAEFAAFDPSGNIRKLVGNNDAFLMEAVNAFNAKTAAYSAAYGNLKNTYGLEYGAFEPASAMLETKKQMAQMLLDDSEYLRDRMQFNLMASRCGEYKITNLVKAYDSGAVDGDSIISSFRKGYSKLLITLIIDSSEVLRTFSGLVFEKKISELSKANDDFEKLTRQEIYIKIASYLPDLSKVEATKESALSDLNKAIKSGGRGVSIRSLFSKMGDLILDLCPCVLMSPLSCAQYLDPEKCNKNNSKEPLFDIVVFDEASQLPTCKAIGVISRGKEAVVVGDPKQMPPTSFFTEQVDDGDDSFETDDLESILDDCLAVNMPQMYLEWHYRSRHESLITFSNKSFYEGRLFTFPSPDDRQSKVTLVDCGGSFDSGKTRTNKIEAQAVIDEITSRAHDPELSKYSVGVVTFNIQQQALIEDLLDLAASKDPVLEKWAFGSEEPVFIKNLENVQGDERDVILFSVGYGKDETGKLIMNFGPLNREGGWRRLNVAVTRSRIEMKVFSSISPEEIRLTDTSSEGVRAFKRFLQYAAGSTVWDQDIASTGSSSDNSGTPLIDRNAAFTGIADDICKRFKAIGYDTDKGVGKSGFKIDIGVVSPEQEGTYCLGILLDGPVYAATGTTTSREVSQMSMLKGFGWNIIRIWSLEWWENPDGVFEKLVEQINNSKKTDEPEKTSSDEDSVSPEASEETTVEDPIEKSVSEDTAQPEPSPEEASTEEPGKEVDDGPKVFIYGVSSEEEQEEADQAESEDQTQKKTDDVDQEDCQRIVYTAAVISAESISDKSFCDTGFIADRLQQYIGEIVDQESPISINCLSERLINAVGIDKTTPKIQQRCKELVNQIKGTFLSDVKLQVDNQKLVPTDEEEEETIFLWKADAQLDRIMDYYRVPSEGEKPRKAKDIAFQEAACAANYLARTQYGMPYENLIVETAKALGFSRVPVNSDSYKLGKRAVDFCLTKEILLKDDDDFVRYNKMI